LAQLECLDHSEAHLSVGLYLLARFSHPQRDPDAVLQRIKAFIEHSCADLAPEISTGMRDTSPTLFCGLHPAAEDLEISFLDANHITASANTAIGAGYHMFVCKLLKSLESAFDLQWLDTRNEEDSDYLDETDYFFTGNIAPVEEAMLDWLRGVCNIFLEKAGDGHHSMMMSMPIGEVFSADGIVTALGPRSLEWAKRVSKNPGSEQDFFAWWNPDLNADYFRNRALARMWREVRWRPPVVDSERNVLKYCVDSLETAHKLDASLDYPWTEWAEMLGCLETEEVSTGHVRDRAVAPPTIGYRRGNVEIDLPGHWHITLPGAFSELEYEDGTTSSLDPPREFWFTAYAFTESSPELFASKRTELIAENPDLLHEAEDYFGTANIKKKSNEEMEWFSLSSSNISLTGRSVCTVIFVDPHDRDWAIQTWKSLEPPKTERR
jgi:hypothetical protein